ncbi:hypothetical protein [Enterobacter cloacae complex sp. 288G10]|uniref:hypothetical protein n=1 Tax=Enterobacter cloacae complex sp. 288G10 TaxID=3395859 RepID=UPI003CEA9DF6
MKIKREINRQLSLQNAMKGEEPASVQIQMRATVTRKERYKAQAIQEDLNLTEWMANHLDAVCDAAKGKASVSIFSRLYRRGSATASTRSYSGMRRVRGLRCECPDDLECLPPGHSEKRERLNTRRHFTGCSKDKHDHN